MCGVVAAVSWDAPKDFPVSLALSAIAHRGPDGRGVWQSRDRRVALGHVRLAIRDIAGGAQPLVRADGNVIAVVNGEIYGAAELRRELESKGHRFATKSDSEIVVHGWAEWREQLPSRLRGEIAFVLWDARDRLLFCARDRFGVKPLAWTEHEGSLLVASQVRALFAMGVTPRWNRDALFQSASLQYAAPEDTLFAGVHELAAGHTLLARDGHVRIERYWDLDVPAEPSALRDEDAVNTFRERFDESVHERLQSDARVCFQLSGGLDSAAVLATAALKHPSPEAFTVSFTDDDAYDEATNARAIADHVGAKHHVVRVSDADVAAHFANAVIAAEGACINAHAAAKIMLSRAIRQAGFKVVLTGEGADETLFGYAHLRSDLEGSADRVFDSNAASAGLMLPDAEGLSLSHVEQTLGFVPTWMRAKAAFGKRMHGVLRDEWLVTDQNRDPARDMLASLDLTQMRGRGRVEQAAYSWTKLALEGYILRALGDGLEMQNGIEGRVPMLDHVLFDLVRSLPIRLKIRGNVEKWILRQAMKDRLPNAVLAREKHPFLAPPIGARTLALARDVFHSSSFSDQPLFDPQKMRTLLDGFAQMTARERKAHDPVIFFALSIATLHANLGMT